MDGDTIPQILGLLIIAVFFGGIGYAVIRASLMTRAMQAFRAHLETLRQTEPDLQSFGYHPNRLQIETINQRQAPPFSGTLTLSQKRLTLYRYSRRQPVFEAVFSFTPDQLRWFGRPQKYTYGLNELWLHVEVDDQWKLVHVWLDRETMRLLVRGLKSFGVPELVIAYRRRRPYIHHGTVKARPATQDIHGAWMLGDAVSLYLMPRYVVILDEGTALRKIPLESIQQIGALKRLDQPRAQGLIRFRAEEETFAFAVDQHEQLAQALAEAAKRTLEAPLEQKRKGKDDDEDFEYDDYDDGESSSNSSRSLDSTESSSPAASRK